MAIDYASLKSTATRLLTENGAEMEIHRSGSTATWVKSFDPVSMRDQWTNSSTMEVVYEEPTGVPQTWEGNGVITSWPKSLVDQGVVQVTDVKIVISIDVEIHNGDVLVLASGREYQIVPPINLVSPNGTTSIVQIVNGRE